MNEILLLLQIFITLIVLSITRRMHPIVFISWILLNTITANLFVFKEISLFGLNATASDVYAIVAIMGANILDQQYDRKYTNLLFSLLILLPIYFSLSSLFHLAYIPDALDSSHIHYYAILKHSPRVVLASLVTFIITLKLDLSIFRHFISRHFIQSNGLSLFISESIDTILFSFLGLSGIVNHLYGIILFSLIFKYLILLAVIPMYSLIDGLLSKLLPTNNLLSTYVSENSL